MRKYLTKSFTLIELLIVIGILSILVVTILVTLNPAEAQKKARDTKRMKDLSTLVAVMEQYIGDGNYPASGCMIAAGGCSSTSTVTCTGATGWLEVDLSKYCSALPTDPANAVARTCVGSVTGGSSSAPTTGACNPVYKVKLSGSNYEVNAQQESKSNAKNTYDDGGNDQGWVETGSDLTIFDNDIGF